MILKRTLIYEGNAEWIWNTLKESKIHDNMLICSKGKIYEAKLEFKNQLVCNEKEKR